VRSRPQSRLQPSRERRLYPPQRSRSANGQRFVSKGGRLRERFSDPDASWGHRSAVSTRKGGGFYGYKIHAAVCTATDLPLAWRVEAARRQESNFVAPSLMRSMLARTSACQGAGDTTCGVARDPFDWLE